MVYRANPLIDSKPKLDEGTIQCQIITGNISTKKISLNYSCTIMKCPLEFSALKIELPAVQVDENYDMSISITNVSKNDVLFELMLPDKRICGLTMTP